MVSVVDKVNGGELFNNAPDFMAPAGFQAD